MQSTNSVTSTDAYYVPVVRNTGYGQPAPIETFDPQWFIPSRNPHHLLHDTSFPNPFFPQQSFETPWFADSVTSSFAPHNNLLHGGFFNNNLAAFQSASSSETTSGYVASPITPARRAQKGKRQCEAKRVQILQNDEYVESFSEARVKCGGCQKSIKLDTRDGARFYPGFWLKHRGRCKKVEELQKEAKKRGD